MNEVSIIVPFCNEASALPHCQVHRQRIGAPLAIPCEFPFVDAGSCEGGVAYLARKAVTADPTGAQGPHFRQRSRHDGRAGLGAKDAVVALDAGLLDPPELMVQVVWTWHRGADVKPRRRRTRAGKSLGERIGAHSLHRASNPIGDFTLRTDAGGLRLWVRKVVDAQQWAERNPYANEPVPGSAWRRG